MPNEVKNDSWMPVDETGNIRFMPLINTYGTAGSNVYLIEYPEIFLLVDLGSEPERFGEVVAIINDVDPLQTKPVLVVITHAHIDHIAAAPELHHFQPRPYAIAAHVNGTPVLAGQDETLTMSFLFRCTPPSIETDLTFFNDAQSIQLGNVLLTLPRPDETCASGLLHQDLVINKTMRVRLYAAPGHSPDSICLLTGNVLLCGDLPFAGNPAVAGIPGWHQKDLLRSYDGVTRLLANPDCTLIGSGHGPLMNRDAALKLFASATRQASAITGIATLDAERSAFLKDYAQALLLEAESAFSIIAGRLLLAAERLEALEEIERSREIRESSILTALDELIDQFNKSTRREDRAGEPMLRAPVKAGYILAKIDKMLADPFFTGVVDPARLRRARNLIVDFHNALQGISFRQLLSAERPDALVQGLLTALAEQPYADDDLMDATDNHALFVEKLTQRLAFRPIFSDITFTTNAPPDLPMVAVERGHLIDTLVGLCELLAVSGGREISIAAAPAEQRVRLSLSTATGSTLNVVTDTKVAFYQDSLRLYGIQFDVQHADGQLAFELLFPTSEAFDQYFM